MRRKKELVLVERDRGMMLTQFLYMVLGEMPAERQKDKIPEIRNDKSVNPTKIAREKNNLTKGI